MVIDWKKLGLWVAGLALLGAFFVFRNEKPTPRPEPPPIRVTLPVPAPPPAPVIVVIPAPKKVAPVVVPSPAPAAKPKSRVKTKCGTCGPKLAAKRKRSLNCSLVPTEAYAHAEWLVVQTARSKGIDENGITFLKACLKQHAEKAPPAH